MNEKYFENIVGLGDLYLEKVFMKFEDENILFICKDEKGERYIGVCYEMRYVLKWVLCKVTVETILQMLTNNITVYECFQKMSGALLLITYTDEQGKVSEWKTLGTIEKRILPDEDFYLKYDMKRDTYYLSLCYEVFSEKTYKELSLKIDGYVQSVNNEMRIPKKKFVVSSRRNYNAVAQTADREWINVCA